MAPAPPAPSAHRLEQHAPLFGFTSPAAAYAAAVAGYLTPPEAGTHPFTPVAHALTQWRLRVFADLCEFAEGMCALGFDDSGWFAVTTPLCWQLCAAGAAAGDPPVYTNITYPIPLEPPRVPERNAVGVFRTTTPPWAEAWRGHRVVLSIEAADSCAEVFCNGAFVGHGTDSKLPLELDVTQHGSFDNDNVFAVVVRRWSAGSFLEDQDHWHLSGLTREVWLRVIPDESSITDINFTATASGLLSGSVRVALEPCGSADWKDLAVDVAIRPFIADKAPRCCASSALPTEPNAPPKPLAELTCATPDVLVAKREATFRFKHRFTVGDGSDSSVRLWSPEAPHLYVLTVALLHRGQVKQVEAYCVGFRSVGISRTPHASLTVNGRPVEVRGVNRHEHCPHRGKVLSQREAWEDIRLLADYGFNALRTSHYPNHGAVYDACDFYGILVIGEANVETHGMDIETSGSDVGPTPWVSSRAPSRHAKLMRHVLAHDERWIAHYVERVARMVARDRNHCSVVVWSLGNESGCGPTFAAMCAYARYQENADVFSAHRRPIAYEGAGVNDGGGVVSDLAFPMYWSSETCEAYCDWKASLLDHATDGEAREEEDECSDAHFHGGLDGRPKPLILCEYSHAMGNSNGNFSDYWDVVRGRHGRKQRFPMFQGGFVWDMIDQGLIDGRDGTRPAGAPDAYRAWVSTVDGTMRWNRNAESPPKNPHGGGEAGKPPPFRYGGDFGPEDAEYPHDANFNHNGLFFPDRVPKPACFEVRHCMQPLHFEWHGSSSSNIVVLPYASFVPPNKYLDFTWQLHDTKGNAISSERPFVTTTNDTAGNDIAEWHYPLQPIFLDGSLLRVAIDESKRASRAPAAVLCRARRRLPNCQAEWNSLSPRDFCASACSRVSDVAPVAYDCLDLHPNEVKVSRCEPARGTTAVSLSEFSSDGGLTWQTSSSFAMLGEGMKSVLWRVQSISGSMHVTLRLDDGGWLENCTYIGDNETAPQIIVSRLQPCFHRSTTDNDEGGASCNDANGADPRASFASRWRAFGLDNLEFACVAALPVGDSALSLAVLVRAKGRRVGRINVRVELDCTHGALVAGYVLFPEVQWPPVARVGVSAVVLPPPGACWSDGASTVQWQGDGPWECYQDRCRAALLGTYQLPLDAMMTPYVKPSESGARTRVHSLSLRTSCRSGVSFAPLHGRPFATASVSRASMHVLATSTHADLVELDECAHVHVDAEHMGVGGDTSWAPHTKARHRIGLRVGAGVAFGCRVSSILL